MKTMILAAGYGTRFRPHTDDLPKPCFPFLNIPLIGYSLLAAEQINSQEVIVNTHHLPDKIEETVRQLKPKTPVHFSFEPEILGNGGGVGNVRDRLSDGPFMVLNSDTVIIPEDENIWAKAVQSHLKSQALSTLLVMPHPEVGTRYGGVWINKENQVFGFGKQNPSPTKPLTPFHFFGVRLFDSKVFKYTPLGNCDIFKDVLNAAIDDQQMVQAIIQPATFFDGGYLEGFLKDSQIALSLFEKSKTLQSAAKRFWPDFDQRSHWRCGTNYHGPTNLPLKEGKLFGQNVSIGKDVTIDGLCVLGDNVSVEDGSYLRNCIIHRDVKIPRSSKIENQFVLK